MSFFIETSWGSLLKWDEELCGDRVELVKQEAGVLLVLSDGLGSVSYTHLDLVVH